MAEPMTKKLRVWNPALDEMRKEEQPGPSPQPLDFSQNAKPSPQMPMFFQNYMHLAPIMMRMQQQQMENAMRQRFLSGMAQARAAAAATMASQVQNSPPVPPPVHSGPPPPVNPLVASALGVQPLSENCCAVCGAHFRLTGDLVTHMRNNHRTTRFKRKNEKPVD